MSRSGIGERPLCDGDRWVDDGLTLLQRPKADQAAVDRPNPARASLRASADIVVATFPWCHNRNMVRITVAAPTEILSELR
jgi:hypothetical protein